MAHDHATPQEQPSAPDPSEPRDLATSDDNEPLEGLPPAILATGDDAKAWEHIPRRAAHIIALVSLGITQAEVAETFRVTQSAVSQCLSKYDPTGSLRLSPMAQRSFLAARFETMAHRALNHVTPDKLSEASAVALLTASAIATDKASKLREEIAGASEREEVGSLAQALRARLQAAKPSA